MIELKVNGNIYGGWKSCRIPFGIEQIAGSFDIGLKDRWVGQDNPYPILVGSECQVLIDNEIVVTGYVDDNLPSFDAKNHEIHINGRDRTGDLVDCSAIYKSGQWLNCSLDQIVRDLCKPFGITVIVDAPVGDKFASYSIQEGEAAFECIDRACRMRAVLPVSNGRGGLILTRAKNTAPIAELIQGQNILKAAGEYSMKERFSEYIIKGQDRAGDDFDSPENHAQVMARATDSFVKRYRPLIVLAEDKGPHATYRQRAEWERNVRRGRSARATITVRGWRNVTGALWRANTMVYLYSPYLGADADLLIAGGSYISSETEGKLTELTLVGREALDLLVGVKTTRLESAISGKKGAAAGASVAPKGKKSDDWSML